MSAEDRDALAEVIREAHDGPRRNRADRPTSGDSRAADAALAWFASRPQPARVAPSVEDVDQAIYRALYDDEASFRSATAIPAARKAVLALFVPQPTIVSKEKEA